VEHEDVFGPGGHNKKQVDDRFASAYMLLYCRTTPRT
jgi:hypothetical protein